MNHKHILIPLVVGAAAFTSCKEKSTSQTSAVETPATETQPNVAETLTAKVEDIIQKDVTPEDRAAKLGFAARLPKDVSTFSAVYNGREAFDSLLKSKLGDFLIARMEEEGVSMADLTDNIEISQQLAAYSEEYFTAYGPGLGDTATQIVDFYESLLSYGGIMAIHTADALIRDGSEFTPMSLQQGLMPLEEGALKGFVPELISIMAKFDMPSVYQGSKISDETLRVDFLDRTRSEFDMVVGMMGELSLDFAEPLSFKKGESEFSGYKFSGEALAKMMDDMNTETLESIIRTEDIDAFKAALTAQNLVIVYGIIDQYVVSFVGASVEDFVLVDKVGDSVCSLDKLKPTDAYLDKNLLAVMYSDGDVSRGLESLQVLGYRSVSALAEGLKKGLKRSSSLGDTQDVEVLLDTLVDQGKALSELFKISDNCLIAYIEDGLKLESYGGPNLPAIDFKTKHSLSSLGTNEGTVFFANWTSNKEYNSLVAEYVDTLFETGYTMAGRVAGFNDIDSRDFKQFQQGYQMFDSVIKKDISTLSGALRHEMGEGLAAESAIVIDLNGTFPKLPLLPEAIVKEAKMPRIAFVSPVEDRKKLQSAWTNANTSIENILKTVESFAGAKIPMQVPMSSEKDGLKTWFVPIPFQNDDFVPSVSVSDDLFFASTSKSFSEGLAEQLKKEGDAASRQGAWIHVNFSALHQYAKDALTLVQNNTDELIESDSAREDFIENQVLIEDTLEAFSGIKSFSSHIRQDNGQTRVSVHFKAE